MTTGFLILLGLPILVAVAIAWDSWRSGKAFRSPLPRRYRNRDSQEAIWHERYSGEMGIADTVLLMLCDAFTFNPDHRYMFRPDDRYIDLYRGRYPWWKVADCMETERFGMELEKRFGIDVSKRIAEITLGDIVDLAVKHLRMQCDLEMPTDMDFDQWVRHVFDHPVANPQWYFQIGQETWDGGPLLTVQYVTRLFESPEQLLKDYSREQLEQGLWYLAGEGQPFMQALVDDSVPWPMRQRGLQAIRTFYEKFFAVACSDELGHRCTTGSTPVNLACYMWWDLFPSYGNPTDQSRQEEDRAILQVMKGILDLPSEACRESALHGLGHWHLHYPEEIERIIDNFLDSNPQMSKALCEYAAAARSGCVQ
jgi:hypothetical protein